MTERPPLQLHTNVPENITLRQLTNAAELAVFSKVLAHDQENLEKFTDLELPSHKELERAVDKPDSIEVGGDMYLGIWQRNQLLGGVMLRNIEGQIDIDFWLEENATKEAIATTALQTLLRTMVGRRKLKFDLVATISDDNRAARRVLERSGFIEKADNMPNHTRTFGVGAQMSEKEIIQSETVTQSPELVARALIVIENLLDEDDYDDEEGEEEEVDFNTYNDNGEAITGTIYHDKKSNILSIETFREINSEYGIDLRQDDNKYLHHTECEIDVNEGEVIGYSSDMVIRDYFGHATEYPSHGGTNTPFETENRSDKRVITDVGLKKFRIEVFLDQFSLMLRRDEEEILSMLDQVVASSID